MLRFCRRFKRDEEGATAIEYALIAGLISVTIITLLQITGPTVAHLFYVIGSALEM